MEQIFVLDVMEIHCLVKINLVLKQEKPWINYGINFWNFLIGGKNAIS